MGGFKNHSLNLNLKQELYEQLCEFIIKCSELMVSNFTAKGSKIVNDEIKITAHFTENYLNNFSVRKSVCNNNLPFKFIYESPENFANATNTYGGRLDIRAASLNYFSCENNDDYYSIECKRIDGSSNLNKKYVTQGVVRFVVPPIKYPSFHNKNIMFGYVVKKINIIQNITKLDSIHKKELSAYILKDIQCIPSKSNVNYYICESEYTVGTKTLSLNHIFYDLSSIIT